MKKRYLIGAAVAFGFGIAAAFAQTITVPQVSIINTDDLMQVQVHGQPSAQSKYASPKLVTAQKGYQVLSPVTGFTYTFGAADSLIVLTNSGTVSAGTITLASSPSDGSEECFYAQNTITTLVVAKASTQTLNNGVTTMTPAAKFCYLYSLATATWNRSK